MNLPRGCQNAHMSQNSSLWRSYPLLQALLSFLPVKPQQKDTIKRNNRQFHGILF